ncbi:hypothetical protein GQ191_001506 [Salmonella enterica]|nr:hypothetical protein [Salmonella enterica]EDT9646282.1 hypothetical protein [Salmonella enterica]
MSGGRTARSATPVWPPLSPITPQQEDRIRQLVREECYFRDREALIKLTAMTLLLKLAGTVMLGLLLLAFRFL